MHYAATGQKATAAVSILGGPRAAAEVDGPESFHLVLVDNGANLGFAAGNNVGLRLALAQPDMSCVWLLNNDTLVEPGCLAAMRDAMQALGGDPDRINPLQPAELVIDHSVQVDEYGIEAAFQVVEDNGEISERAQFTRPQMGIVNRFLTPYSAG